MFEAIHERAQKGGITLAEFFLLLSGRGHQLVILFLALPFLQPIPLIGLSTPLGFLIGVVGWLHYRDQAPWVPRRFQKLEISQRVLSKTVQVGRKFWQIADRLKMHPRWFFVLDTKTGVLRLIRSDTFIKRQKPGTRFELEDFTFELPVIVASLKERTRNIAQSQIDLLSKEYAFTQALKNGNREEVLSILKEAPNSLKYPYLINAIVRLSDEKDGRAQLRKVFFT